MSDISNLLWQVQQLDKELKSTKAELADLQAGVADLRGMVTEFIAMKHSILERVLAVVELSVEIQATELAALIPELNDISVLPLGSK